MKEEENKIEVAPGVFEAVDYPINQEESEKKARERAQILKERRKQAELERFQEAVTYYRTKQRPDLEAVKETVLRPNKHYPIWIAESMSFQPWNPEGEIVYTLAIGQGFSYPMDKEGVQALIDGLQASIGEKEVNHE